MGYIPKNKATDAQLWDRTFARYRIIYPEASDPAFEPNFSGHDDDWDIIFEEESDCLKQEREDEKKNPPAKDAPPPKTKSKGKSKSKKGKTAPVEQCSTMDDPNAANCFYDSIIFSCKTGTELVIAPYSPKTQSVYEVLCGRTTDLEKIKIEIGGQMKGPCADHKGKTFYAYGDNHKVINKTDIQLELEVASNHVDQGMEEGQDAFFNDNFNLDHKPEKVKIAMMRCGYKEELTFHIYPKYEFALGFSIKCEDKKYEKQESGKYGSDREGKDWKEGKKQKYSFSKSYNGVKIDLSRKLEPLDDFEKLYKLFDKISKFTHTYLAGYFWFELLAPNVSGTGTWGYKWDSETYTVRKNGSIKIEAKPLFGAKGTVSLLKAGLGMAGCGPILMLPEKVKHWTNGAVALEFDVTASIAGTVNIAVEQLFQWNKGLTSKVDASVELTLEISLAGTIDAYIFKVSASAKASACGKFSVQFNLTQLFWPKGDFKFAFDGMTITLYGYVEAGIWWWSSSSEFTHSWDLIEASDIATYAFGADN